MIERVTAGVEAFNLKLRGVIESPLKGDKGGNTEFLAHFVHDPATGPLRLDGGGAPAARVGGRLGEEEHEEDDGEEEGPGSSRGSGNSASSSSTSSSSPPGGRL